MRLRDIKQWFVTLLLAVGLVGCAGGLVKPQSLEDKVYYAQGQVKAAYDTIADLADQKRITKEQGDRLLKVTNSANEAVQAAKLALAMGDIDITIDKMKIVQILLLELEQFFLKEQQDASE